MSSYELENVVLFSRLLRTKALGAGVAYALSQWGPNSKSAAVVQKSILGTADVRNDPDLRAASNGFIGLVRNRSLIARIAAISPFRNVPFETQVLNQQSPVQASWAGEGQALALTSSLFDTERLGQKKLGAVLPTTKELVTGTSVEFEGALNRELAGSIAKLEGGSFIDAANAGDEYSPAAVTHGVAPVTGTTDAKKDIAALLEGFTGDLESAVLVTRPQTGLHLYNAGYLGAGVRGGDVGGLPLVTSESVKAGTVALIDPSRILMADDGVSLDTSDESTLIDSEGNALSIWQENLIAVRAVRYLNWQTLSGSVSTLSASWA